MNKKLIFSLLAIMLCISKFSFNNSPPVITIFVHGTVAPGAALFSPVAMVKKKLSGNTWCNQIVQKVRKDEIMQQDWPMLEEGMIEIDQEILNAYHQQTLKPELGKFSAYHMAGAYDFFQKQSNKNIPKSRYFFYGHSGLLDDQERKNAGRTLYDLMIKLRNEYKENQPIFTLVGHSYGGLIGLYTALGEAECNENLVIENLILWGMPLEKTQADLIMHPMFKNIYNFFSSGDKIQTNDYISTASGRSYARLEDVIDTKRAEHRFDIQLFVENDKKAITHHTMWLFGKYDNALSMRSKKTRRSLHDAFNLMSPVCLAAYSPVLIKNLEMINTLSNPQGNFQHINLNLTAGQDRLFMQAKAYSYEIENPKYVTLRAKTLWEPYAVCSEMKKHKLILKTAFNTIFRK